MVLRERQKRWCQAEDTADIVKGVTEEIVLSQRKTDGVKG